MIPAPRWRAARVSLALLVLGFEALARPADEYGLTGPHDAFEGAARLQSIDDLDALCRESALAQVGDLPDGVAAAC